MFFVVLITTYFVLYKNVVSENFQYSREELQKKYPGFGTDWIPLDIDSNGKYIIGEFNPKIENRFNFYADPSEVVTFTLFTRENSNGTLIEKPITKYKIFNKNKPVKFVTHGWMSSGTADTCIKIKDGFLKKYDANVFIVDWSEISKNFIYPVPMYATKSVGEFYATFLNEIIQCGIDPQNIHLVGHSLGAHVSGFAARGVKDRKIGRVTGLDPALPGFEHIELVDGGGLHKNDAEFVDIIHTCGGYLGIKDSIGHADFYPNGGSVPQPGCNYLELMEACSHGRSWAYFAESLVSPIPFMAYPCKSYENKNTCKKEAAIQMGEPTPTTARGDYYLKTDTSPPFAIKDINLDIDN